MKRITFLSALTATLMIAATFDSTAKAESAQEKAAIEAAEQQYINGNSNKVAQYEDDINALHFPMQPETPPTVVHIDCSLPCPNGWGSKQPGGPEGTCSCTRQPTAGN